MSFSKSIKDFICNNPYKSNCCKRSMLLGMAAVKAKINNDSVLIAFDGSGICDFFSKLLFEVFSVKAVPYKSSEGGRKKQLMFHSGFIYDFIKNLESKDAELFIKYKCSSCKTAALRGMFLACGKMTDPEKQFCLEFSLDNRINTVNDYFVSLGLNFNKSITAKSCRLYAKRTNLIEDFFGMASLQSVTYDVINSSIKKSINNKANRVSNAEFVNIAKTVDTAKLQCDLISKLSDFSLIEMLPEDLKYTAMLRLENPDASLSSLALLHTPRISKSGIKHRFDRIFDIGQALLKSVNSPKE